MAESWEDAMEVFSELEEREPEAMKRLALEEEARYRKELAYFREKQTPNPTRKGGGGKEPTCQ